MNYFDFSEHVERAVADAKDFPSQLSAKTTVHRAMFPSTVVRAGFRLLRRGDSFQPGQHDIVIGAAPWSDPDLVVLEDLTPYARSRDMRIVVFDVDDIPYAELESTFPGVYRFRKTPIVLLYRNGELTVVEQGIDAVRWLRQL